MFGAHRDLMMIALSLLSSYHHPPLSSASHAWSAKGSHSPWGWFPFNPPLSTELTLTVATSLWANRRGCAIPRHRKKQRPNRYPIELRKGLFKFRTLEKTTGEIFFVMVGGGKKNCKLGFTIICYIF
ncbi:hypothetical protein CBL_05321 [Carabus blaptoides fortunei]